MRLVSMPVDQGEKEKRFLRGRKEGELPGRKLETSSWRLLLDWLWTYQEVLRASWEGRGVSFDIARKIRSRCSNGESIPDDYLNRALTTP